MLKAFVQPPPQTRRLVKPTTRFNPSYPQGPPTHWCCVTSLDRAWPWRQFSERKVSSFWGLGFLAKWNLGLLGAPFFYPDMLHVVEQVQLKKLFRKQVKLSEDFTTTSVGTLTSKACEIGFIPFPLWCRNLALSKNAAPAAMWFRWLFRFWAVMETVWEATWIFPKIGVSQNGWWK